MIIGLRAGHSPNCLGAEGIISEYYSCYSIYCYLKILLEKQGHIVVDCNSCASTESKELNEGTNKANSYDVDLFISLHMNAFGNSQAHGSEVYMYPTDGNTSENNKSKERIFADRILENLHDKGFTNRGVKFNKNFHDLSMTVMQAMIVEICFVTSPDDVNIYKRLGAEKIAKVIAKAFGDVDENPVDVGGWRMLEDGLHYYDSANKEIIHIPDKDVKL